MPITSSSIVADVLQEDGIRQIQQMHTPSSGPAIVLYDDIPPGSNANVRLTARADELNRYMHLEELRKHLRDLLSGGDVFATTYIESTEAERADFLYAWLKRAETKQTLTAAGKLGPMTDGQLSILFPVARLTNVKNRIAKLATLASLLEDALVKPTPTE